MTPSTATITTIDAIHAPAPARAASSANPGPDAISAMRAAIDPDAIGSDADAAPAIVYAAADPIDATDAIAQLLSSVGDVLTSDDADGADGVDARSYDATRRRWEMARAALIVSWYFAQSKNSYSLFDYFSGLADDLLAEMDNHRPTRRRPR